ncbi:MAG TPA: hypothetical protein PLB85_06660, partial [Candidatus Syntrophosphaera sp.]|nr:hypothetical protein [Candidatus Syntrophosphaera sp.]
LPPSCHNFLYTDILFYQLLCFTLKQPPQGAWGCFGSTPSSGFAQVFTEGLEDILPCGTIC